MTPNCAPAAADNQQRLRLALAASRTAVWEWDLVTDELKWAPESFPIAGGVVFHPTGASYIRQLDPRDAPRVLAAVKRAIEGHGTFGEEYRFEAGDGHVRWLVNHGQVEYGPDGQAVRVVGTLRDISEAKQVERRLQQLSGRLLQAQDEERRHLARELHDVVAQELATLCLNLHLLGRPDATATEAAELLNKCRRLAEDCARDVRTRSYLLHPPLLDEFGLAGAVRAYADGFATRSGVRVDLQLPPDLGRLPRAVELTLFRVLQESLTNVMRHAESRTASVRIALERAGVRLEVSDRGRGLRPEAARAAGNGLGVGILGMRERLRQLGGSLQLEMLDPGTRVVAFVPLGSEEEAPR